MKKVSQVLFVLLIFSLVLVAFTANVSALETSNVYSWTPDTVTLTSVKSSDATSISLEWENKSYNWQHDGYKIYRANSKSGVYSEVNTITDRYATSYTDKKLTTGKTYYYKVCQYNASSSDQNGEFSNVKSAKVVPQKVSFSAVATEKNKMSLTWTKAEKGVDGYVIYRASSEKGTYTAIKRIKKAATTSYTDTGVTHGKFYYYKIKAFTTVNGKSVYSTENEAVRNKVDVRLCRPYFTKIGTISPDNDKYIKLIKVKYGSKTLTEGKDYNGYSYGKGWSGDALTDAYYSVYGCYDSDFTGSHEFNVYTISDKAQLWDVSITNSGITLSWKKVGGVGYKIYRKAGSGSFSCVKTITDNAIDTWVDKGANKAGTKYQYYIKVYTEKSDKKLYTKQSDTMSIKRIGMPKLKSVTNKKAGIAVSWNASKGAKSYEILRKTGNGNWESLANTTDTQYIDKTAKVGTRYTYSVCCRSGEYSWNSQRISYYDPKGLQAERLVTAEGQSLSSSSLKITWNKSSTATGYVIYRATSAKGTYKKIKTITSKSTVSFTDTKLTFGKYYYYRIRPYTTKSGKTTYGSYGPYLKIRPTVGPVTQKKVKITTYCKVTLSWEKVSKADGYQVFQATSEDGPYKKVKTVTGNGTVSCTVSKLENAKTYYFKIRAYRKSKGTTYFGGYSKVKSRFMDKLGYDGESYESRVKRIWGGTEYKGYTTSTAAKKDMKTIKIKTWDINSKGKKYTRYHYLTVHKNIAPTVEQIFKEIYNGKEKFPIKSVGGYSWRGTGVSSQHGAGLAIDINPHENAQFSGATGKPLTGSFWKPGKNPYSIKPDGDVVRAFEKYGFGWGDWFGNPDYMHFSYFGT